MSLLQSKKWLVLCGVVVAGCGGEDQSPSQEWEGETRSDALYSQPSDVLWPANQPLIPVCWETPGYAAEKQAIRNSVARTWSYESQVAFTWTDACPTTGTDRYIRVLLTTATDPAGQGGGSASISLGLGVNSLRQVGQGESMHIAVPKTTYPNYQGRLDYIASHEFGHILGFRHEQDRAEAAGACGGTVTLGPIHTKYDPESLMDYCRSVGLHTDVLSAIDKVGIASLYGPRRWTQDFEAPATGVDRNLRHLADVDGDGKDEVVYFDAAGVRVAASDVPSRTFSSSQFWIMDFGTNAGWLGADHPRTVVDVNADGRADIVGFGEWGVSVSYSTGSQFTPGGFAFANFAHGAGGWLSPVDHPRMVADVNGDGAGDIIGFGTGGVFVALSQCQGSTCTAATQFGPVQFGLAAFGYDPSVGGWSNGDRHPRMAADVNGDGKADLVGFGEGGVIVALSTSTGSTVSFGTPQLWLSDFGADPAVGGWTSAATYPRRMGDLNGDGKADVIGFGHDYVWVSFSTGTGFLPAQRVLKNLVVSSGSWTASQPRVLGDVDSDGKVDLIGFSPRGTQVFPGKNFHASALTP